MGSTRLIMSDDSIKDATVPWEYANVPQSDAVAIICGGPSTKKYAKKAKQWIKKNSAKVIAANYNYGNLGLKSHYTYITDSVKFLEVIEDIDSHLILPCVIKGVLRNGQMREKFGNDWKHKIKKYAWIFKDNGKNVYVSGFTSASKKNRLLKTPHVYSTIYGGGFNRHLLSISDEGKFHYERFGPAGQGAMLMSLVLKPKKILVIGLDGPNGCSRNGMYSKVMYNGTRHADYGSIKRIDRVTSFVKNVLVPTIQYNNVVIQTFSEVGFYKLNKVALGLDIIK
jgi:hypothetical protein